MENSVNIEIFTEGNIKLPYNGISKKFLESSLTNISHILKLKRLTITMIITDNDSIRSVNKTYRDIDEATDTISFAYRENPFPGIDIDYDNLGDIYLSIEKAKEYSDDSSSSLEEEVKRLLCHAILHLVGYDHEKSDKERMRMEIKEDEILKKL